MLDDIPTFLDRRTQPKGPTVTTETKPRTRRQDCYTANIKVQIPLDMSNAATLTEAMDAVAKVKDHLPAGAIVTVTAGLGKI